MKTKIRKSHGRPRERGRPSAAGAENARPLAPDELRQQGLRAFKAERYVEAIEAWERVEAPDHNLAPALAEAHFRQAVMPGRDPAASSLAHLQRAVALAPDDPLYAYHLGLALHKQGRAAEALDAYRSAVSRGLSRPGAGVVIALAALEVDPGADLATVPGVSPDDRRQLEPALVILRALQRRGRKTQLAAEAFTAQVKPGKAAASQLALQGLALLASGDAAEARRVLLRLKNNSLSREANAVRWHCAGVAVALTGDLDAAIEAWAQAHSLQPDLLLPRHNLATAYARQAEAHIEAELWSRAAEAASHGLKLLPHNARLGSMAVMALDRAAQESAGAGDWATAADQWAAARGVLDGLIGGGSPRPLLHNLALAHEALEEWEDAAEAWRAMLRARPRKKAAEGFSDDHWLWLRRHVIDCYRLAGQPGQAIAVFRQALKATPDDVDLQLDLAEAYAANQQEGMAAGALARLLEKQPQHVGALTRLAELHAARQEWHSAEMLLRQAMAVEPQNEDLPRRLAHLLSERARQAASWGDYAAARTLCEAALAQDPDSFALCLNLARMELNCRLLDGARQHIERALELSEGNPDVYRQAFVCWVVENDLAEARKVLARAEAEAPWSAEEYVDAGMACIERASSPMTLPDPMGWFVKKPKPGASQREQVRLSETYALGQELLEKAIALGPAREVLHHILIELGYGRPQTGIPYARRLVEATPDDALAWATLGVMLGVDGQVEEAQTVLRTAARTARRQNDHESSRMITDLRHVVADPAFPSMMLHANPFEAEPEFDYE